VMGNAKPNGIRIAGPRSRRRSRTRRGATAKR
jgi:hypothetical protein